jgi:putative heme-binding domain-containing protein
MDLLRPSGSGFVASHGPDFLLANDAWARFINMKSGPDGNAFFIDWYDKQACHLGDVNAWDRSNGRIYKLSYQDTEPVQVDLAAKTDRELVEMQLDDNDWYGRHARRLLQERAARHALAPATHEALAKIAFGDKSSVHRLRALWGLHVTGALTEERTFKALADSCPYCRGWAVQLALENGAAGNALMKKLVELARNDSSPIVRLYLASGALRIPPGQRWELLEGLLAHAEDAADHNLPCMNWYAAEPLASVDSNRALNLAARAKLPTILPFMVTRLASSASPKALAAVLQVLDDETDAIRQLLILQAINKALSDRRQVSMPANWDEIFPRLARSPDPMVRTLATALAVTFGQARAFEALRQVLDSERNDPAARQKALEALLGAKDPKLPPLLQRLVADRALRGAAIRGLAAYDDPGTPDVLLSAYPTLTVDEARAALNTLASRASYGKALMDAIAAKKVPANAVPAEVVRQLRNLNDTQLTERMTELWGIVRTTPADRLKLIGFWKYKLTTIDSPPDLALGRALFAKTCQQCHNLFGVGGKVGPDITGSNRASLDYLLENILDPSAVIPNEYKATVIALKSGRLVTGIVRGGTPAALSVVTATETLTIPRDEIESETASNTSMMPDDLLKSMSDFDVFALIAYLRNPNQVPILATLDNAKELFNGKDLTGWDGDPKLWSVDNDEIVGKSPGIRRNEFLKSQMVAGDFRFSVKVRLTPNKENSGVQFRSEALPQGEVRGPQADVGEGWWGKLYEENGRGILSDRSGEDYVHREEWNDYEIVAQGSHVKTSINGHACVDVDDPKIARRGFFAFQIHSGGPMEVRFKDLKLEVLPPPGPKN